MKNVVIYARYSSDNQREESIESQIRICSEYIHNNNLICVGHYIDRAFTGTNDKRPDFQKMIDDSSKGLFDTVLILKLDRFSRNTEETIKYINILSDNGVELKSVIEKFDNSPEGELMRNMMSNMSQFYVRNLARSVHHGLTQNALKSIATGGIPPLGLKKNTITKKYEIDETEEIIVKKIFKMYVEGKTHPQIIRELNDCGYTNKKGNQFTKNSLLSILRNEKYVGTYVWNKSVAKNSKGKRNGNKQKPEEEIIRIPNAIPQIVDTEIFEKAQELMKARAKGDAPRRRATTYVLSGLIQCECGSHMHGNRRRAKTRSNPNWKEKPEYVSYRCGGRKTKANCEVPEIRKEYIEAFVFDELEKVIFNDNNLEHLLGLLNGRILQESAKNQDKIHLAQSKLDKVEKEIGNLVKAIAKGIDAEEILDELSTKKRYKAQLLMEIDNLKNSEGIGEITIDTMRELISEVKPFLMNNSMPELKALLKKFVKSITVGKEEIEVIFNLFFSFGIDYDYLHIRKTIKRNDLYVPFARRLSLKIQRLIELERSS